MHNFHNSASVFVFMSTSKVHRGKKGVHGDKGMYMTLSVGGKINVNRMKRRKNRGGSGIMKTEKKCFLQLFSHGKAPVIPLSLLQ